MKSSYERYHFPEWVHVPYTVWLECARTAPWGLDKWHQFKPLVADLRKCFPIPLEEQGELVRDVHVVLAAGQGVPRHKHKEWTAIFYAFPGDPVCPLIVAGETVEPKRCDAIIIPPGVWHEVPKSRSERQRVSFAIQIEDPPE